MPQVSVLYDEDCGWCRWSVAQVLALDRRGALRPVAIQSAEGERLLAGVPQELRLVSAHAVGKDRRVSSAGDTAAPIAAVLPGGSVTAPVLRALGPLTRAAYRLIAGNRSRLGRLVTPAMLERADAVIAASSYPPGACGDRR